MKTNKWILGGLMAMAITACTSDELVENTNPAQGKKVTVTAYAPGDEANSRVSFVDDNTSKVTLSWNDSESFSVVCGINIGTFSKTTTGNTFTGVLPASATTPECYYAVYPALAANASLTTENTVPFDLSTQTGALDESKTYMRALSESGFTYSFQHCTAILKATFAGIPSGTKISQVVVNTSHADSKVDGNLNLTTGTISGGSKNSITINYATAVNASNPVYIYLPPMDAGKKTLTFVVTTDDEKKYTGTLAGTNANSIVAGNVYKAELSLTEKVEVNPAKNELRYVETEKTFYVSGPNGLLALNKWMTSTGDDSHNEFINIGFPITGTLSSSSRLSGNITLEADITLPLKTSDGTEITIGNNGVPSGSNWNPVGDNYNNNYKGVIDGGNYTITNIVVSSSTYYYSGFVGYLNTGGSVKNLKLDNVHISAGKSNCAAVVGNLNNTTVENCHVLSGSVNGNGTGYVGGIVGNTNSGFGIIGCTNNATIQGTGNYVGGIVGYLEDNNSSSSKARVICCANLGEVNSAGAYVGGIVGYKKEYGKVVGCWTIGTNEKDENGAETADTNKDGIGCLKGSLTRCYSAAKKGAEESAQKYINDKVSTMNSGLNSYGWQWISGTDSSIDWPTLRKN